MKSKNMLSIILLSFVLSSCSIKVLDGKVYKEYITYTYFDYDQEVEYQYDNKGNIISKKWYILIDSNKDLICETKYEYDKQNNLIYLSITYYEENGNINYIMEDTFYDDKQTKSSAHYEYNLGKIDYLHSNLHEYAKDSMNKKIYHFTEEGTKYLDSQDIYEQTYENDVLIHEIQYNYYYNLDGSIDYKYTHKHIYNFDGNQSTRKTYNYNSSNEEFLSVNIIENFDPNNNLIEKIYYTYDQNNVEKLHSHYAYEYIYNDDNSIAKCTYFEYNLESQAFELQYSYEYEYDVNKNIITRKSYRYEIERDDYVSKTVLDSIGVSKYEYDSNNLLTKEEHKGYDIELIGTVTNENLTYETVIEYNSNNDEVYYSKKEYDENNTLIESELRITIYNELFNLLSYKCYKNDILSSEQSCTYNSDNNLTNQTTKSYDEKGNITDFYIRDLYYYDLSKKGSNS